MYLEYIILQVFSLHSLGNRKRIKSVLCKVEIIKPKEANEHF